MNLTDYCNALAVSTRDACAWIEKNADTVRNEQEGLQKELRRAGRLFRHCAKASKRKMCAGVFGPSQSGKSYLISALARDASGALSAVFGNERHNFIQEINPEGGKESTGLVTRFTMTHPERIPEGHPVQIRLLTETDLVKIIANTYFADCEHKEDPQSDIHATLALLEKRPEKPSSRIDIDAMEDLREYLLKDFRAKARVVELERSYWSRAIALAPKLALEDRVRLYSIIWDEVEEFTSLLRHLLLALEHLGHPEEAFCPIESLIPRTGSIIDVATLGELNPETDVSTLDVATLDGRSVNLPRSVVAALTAELTISMDHKPAPYFDHTDLLDFPGYRSRYKFDDVRRELKKPGLRKEMFLRGKVAYLFQRYCADRELTSMLLCIGPKNQEVQDLPGVINDWIIATHGERPEDRAGKPESLFFILTMFDVEFEQKEGTPSVESRWDNRIHASLLDFFGKQHDWPREWDGTRAFNNLFLLRNPNYKFTAVLDYEGKKETGIRKDMLAYVQTLESAFLNSGVVAAHFKNPRESWEAAMLLNDGGISHIRNSLSPLCNPDIKRNQLRHLLDDQRKKLVARLSVFYKSDNKEEERKQKLLFIRRIYTCLGRLEKQHQRLGLLLHSFTVRDSELFELHSEARQRYRSRPEPVPEQHFVEEEEAIDLTAVNIEDWNPFSTPSTPERTTEKEQPASLAIRDEESFFAEYVESWWVSKLHALADDPVMQHYFLLPSREFSDLVSELATGAARLNLAKDIAAAARDAARYTDTNRENVEWQQAGMAASILNAFVDWLGRNPRTKTEQERTFKTSSGSSVLFAPPPVFAGMPQLSENRTPYTADWYGDWLNAFYLLAMENLDFDGEQMINREENTCLGTIIARFNTDLPRENA